MALGLVGERRRRASWHQRRSASTIIRLRPPLAAGMPCRDGLALGAPLGSTDPISTMSASNSSTTPDERDDVQDTLAAFKQVDDLTVGVGQHGAVPTSTRLVAARSLAEPVPQALDGATGPLQRDAGVEKLLDDLQLEDVV